MLTLHSYNISPYAAKIRAVLAWKRIPFVENLVHPARRGFLKRLTGKLQVPVIVDGGEAITDSTAIVRHLEARYPERPVLPAEPSLRARALLLEEWADEGLPHIIQPVRWLVPENRRRTMARFRAAYPPGPIDDALFRVVALVAQQKERRRFGGLSQTELWGRLAEVLGVLDGALAETGFLAGPTPSVADFAVYGFVHLLEGLDGWETVRAHRRVAKLVKVLAPTAQMAAKETYDPADEAQIEASRLRRAGKS
ncbi:MAG: glutathione S-transferase family protein [Myxococcales bacterium]|nr:glutathione S-transferase family protein [Myxococcales bacterium]